MRTKAAFFVSMPSPVESSTAKAATQVAVVWLNGKLVTEDEAVISPFDHGLLTGDGVFETLVTHERKPFADELHYERLKHSATAFGLEIPRRDDVRGAIAAVIEANPHLPDRMRIRVTVTGGCAPLGSEKGTQEATFLVAAAAPPERGPVAKIVRVPWCRNERGAMTGVKTTSYGENVVALAYARERGASEAIFGNTLGQLCEGSGSNIFLVREGIVFTPPLSSGCLAGVTRALVLDLCPKLGLKCREMNLSLSELDDVGEAFLTSTLRDVQPVGEIDRRVISPAGEMTRRVIEGFQKRKREG
jgi:branched-chain amino acid aminotransferase